MPWRPLPRIAFAICTHPFHPSSPADLPLQIGDELYIIEQGGKDGAWYRGYLVAPPSLLSGLTSGKGQTLEARVFSGIFPRDCVEVRELLGEPTGYGQEDESSSAKGSTTPSSSVPSPPRNRKSLEAISAGNTQPVARASSRQNLRSDARTAPADGRSTPAGAKPAKPPAPVPMLKIGDESSGSKQEPLVDEIAASLREWHSTSLHELLLGREYGLLDELSELVSRLDLGRRQLLHNVLTTKELRNMRESAVWDLVRGNKITNGQIIVRSATERGRVLTSDDSVLEVCRLQSMMSLLDERPLLNAETKSLRHLLVNIVGTHVDEERPIAYVIALYTKDENGIPRNLSENYSIDVNPEDTDSHAALDAKARTLFTDVLIPDESVNTPDPADIYLVVKILAAEPLRGVQSTQPRKQNRNADDFTTSAAGNGGPAWRSSSLKSGRMSFVLESAKSLKGGNSRPTTANSQQKKSMDTNRPSTSQYEVNGSKEGKPVKRTVAVGILEVANLVKDNSDSEREMKIWSATEMGDRYSQPSAELEPLINAILPRSSGGHFTDLQRAPITLRLKSFVHSDSKALVQSKPTYLHNVHLTQRIGFCGAPTRSRSDIYLTLTEPYVPKNAFLSHPRVGTVSLPDDSPMANIQLTMEVRNARGDRIPNCIYPASNSLGHTAWRTTAIERGQSWNQTIRIGVTPEEVPGSHIVMSLTDASNFPFALCWLPLWSQNAFVRDGAHSLALYRYDEDTSRMIAGKGAYLALPWSSKTKDETVTGPVASLSLRSYLCSTKYSQDPNLLDLLKWRDQGSREIVSLLVKFPFVAEIEIVKLLDEVLDALFQILVEYANNDEIEDRVFSALVNVLSIVHDRRFDVQPDVDRYAAEKFKYPFAFPCLIRGLIRMLADPTDPESARRLRATSKVGRHIFMFIIAARKQQITKEIQIGIDNHGPTFAKDLKGVFFAMKSVMRNDSPTLIGTKTLLVQHFHTWLPEISKVFSPAELLDLVSDFIESCLGVQGKLTLYKLLLIKNVSSLRLFSDSVMQQRWHHRVVQWIDPFWGAAAASSQQLRDQVRLCCSIASTHVTELGLGDESWMQKLVESYRAVLAIPRTPSESFSLLFPTTYPFTNRPTNSKDKYDEVLIELAALLATISTNIADYPRLPPESMSTLLVDMLEVFRSILACDAFPASWLSAHIVMHTSVLKSLQTIHDLLQADFLPHPDNADQFPTNLWRSFFTTLLKLAASEALALEVFPDQKRRAVWKISGDVREMAADLLEKSWFGLGWDASQADRDRFGFSRLGGYQVQYVPGLVGQVVELCLSVHDGIRAVAIMVLRTMIISEWALSNDLDVLQGEAMRSLDQMFQTKRLHEGIVQKLLVVDLYDAFEPLESEEDEENDDALFMAVKVLLATLDELLDLLIAVHNTADAGEAFQIMDTLRLMQFLKDRQKDDIYIDYVRKLAQVQSSAQNPTEAGLALKMFADVYSWDESTVVPATGDKSYPSQSSFKRKEQIYNEMISYFEDGSAWQNAMHAYTELSKQYEYHVYDFSKLARCQRAMANIYEKIRRGDGNTPRYFRVEFRGLGFPPTMRDRQFIFESTSKERMSSFADTMQKQYPAAKIINSGNMDDYEGQYITIYPLGPQKDLYHPVNRRIKVPQPVREHYMLANPQKFTTTSRRHGNGDVKDHVQEKIVYTTAEPFPNMLRQSEIVNVESVRLSPVQIGLERTIRKTQDLSSLAHRVADGSEGAFQTLTDTLKGLVNDSEGCVAAYWTLLPTAAQSSEEATSDELRSTQESLLEEALRVAMIDHVITIRRILQLYDRPSRQNAKVEITRDLERTFASVISSSDALVQEAQPNGEQPAHLVETQPQQAVQPTQNNAEASHIRNESEAQTDAKDTNVTSPPITIPSTPTDAKRNQVNGFKSMIADQSSTRPARLSLGGRPIEEDLTSQEGPSVVKSSTTQSIQSRVGNMTKRLSSFNLGWWGNKQSARQPAFEKVAE